MTGFTSTVTVPWTNNHISSYVRHLVLEATVGGSLADSGGICVPAV